MNIVVQYLLILQLIVWGQFFLDKTGQPSFVGSVAPNNRVLFKGCPVLSGLFQGGYSFSYELKDFVPKDAHSFITGCLHPQTLTLKYDLNSGTISLEVL